MGDEHEPSRAVRSATPLIVGERRLDAERAEMIGRIVAIVILIVAVALIVFGPIREF